MAERFHGFISVQSSAFRYLKELIYGPAGSKYDRVFQRLWPRTRSKTQYSWTKKSSCAPRSKIASHGGKQALPDEDGGMCLPAPVVGCVTTRCGLQSIHCPPRQLPQDFLGTANVSKYLDAVNRPSTLPAANLDWLPTDVRHP
jgi:hypothetical protein